MPVHFLPPLTHPCSQSRHVNNWTITGWNIDMCSTYHPWWSFRASWQASDPASKSHFSNFFLWTILVLIVLDCKPGKQTLRQIYMQRFYWGVIAETTLAGRERNRIGQRVKVNRDALAMIPRGDGPAFRVSLTNQRARALYTASKVYRRFTPGRVAWFPTKLLSLAELSFQEKRPLVASTPSNWGNEYLHPNWGSVLLPQTPLQSSAIMNYVSVPKIPPDCVVILTELSIPLFLCVLL